MPQLLHDLLRYAVDDAIGLELVRADPGLTLTEAVDASDADIVVSDERSASPAAARELLDRRPRTRVLAVSGDGHSGVLYELRPHRSVIGDIGVGAIVANLHAPVEGSAPWPDDQSTPTR